MKKITMSIILLLMIMSCGSNNTVVTLDQHKLLNKAVMLEYPDAEIYWVDKTGYLINDDLDVYYIRTYIENNEGMVFSIQPIYAREDITLTPNGISTLTIYVGCILYGDEEYMLYEGNFYKIKVYSLKSATQPLHSIKKLIRIQ